MIVEVIGCSGAGKTRLARLLGQIATPRRPVVLASDMIMHRPGRRWIDQAELAKIANLATDVTVLPSLLQRRSRDATFLRFAFERIRVGAPSRFTSLNYRREVLRNVGRYAVATRLDPGAAVIIDEGSVLTAYHVLVYTRTTPRDADIDRFAALVPLPDRVLYVTAPVSDLVDRARRRDDRRRELAGRRAEVERWVTRAVDVFDRLVATERLRDRTLTVPNPDDRPHALHDSIDPIIGFLDAPETAVEGRRGELPAAGQEAATR